MWEFRPENYNNLIKCWISSFSHDQDGGTNWKVGKDRW
jgi:hypothetical protein